MSIELQPGSPVPGIEPEYSEEELQKLVDSREDLLNIGFSGCDVRLPTKTWHGVRIEAFVDLDLEADIPFIPRQPSYMAPYKKLMAWTLSGINFDLGLGTEHAPLHKHLLLPEITIDKDIKAIMTKMTKLGHNLAYEGLGFPKQYPWMIPMEHVDYPVVLCEDNKGRRHDEMISAAFQERVNFWEQRGWIYSPWAQSSHSAYKDMLPEVSVLKFTEFNPDEDTLENCVASVACNANGAVSGRLTPDWRPATSIDPNEVLSLEELAQLQQHTIEEFASGCLSDEYLTRHKTGPYYSMSE